MTPSMTGLLQVATTNEPERGESEDDFSAFYYFILVFQVLIMNKWLNCSDCCIYFGDVCGRVILLDIVNGAGGGSVQTVELM